MLVTHGYDECLQVQSLREGTSLGLKDASHGTATEFLYDS